jgi:lysophospholipase L1-like esterase
MECAVPTKELLRPLTREELDANFAATKTDTVLQWHNALDFTVEGRGWNDTDLVTPYDRLPARAKIVVRPEVWELSRHSSGITVYFSTDASEICAQWTVTNHNLAMNHMAATGVSGLDLYVKSKGNWQWLGVGRPVNSPTNTVVLASDIPSVGGEIREYCLYLPLYNGIVDLRIGVPKSALIQKLLPKPRKTVVFYGTSITQGGCASRPGMSYAAIVGRALDLSTINLGFSGNGQAEPEVATLVAELNPDIFLIDPVANINPSQVEWRIPEFVNIIREKHPLTPIVIMECITPTFNHLQNGNRSNYSLRNESLEKTALPLMADDKNIFYIQGKNLLGKDNEATVDGIHPTDLGFYRIADVVKLELKKILNRKK